MALNWIIAQGAVPIPGAKNAQQARQNAGALVWRMSDAHVAALSELAQLGKTNTLRKMQPYAWLGGVQAMHRPKPRHQTGTRAMPGDTPPAIFRGNASLPQSGSIAGPGGEDALVPSSTARRARNKVPEGAPSTPSAGIALY